MNLCLQGKAQLINSMFDRIKAFETKLRFWGSQIRKNNFTHFPALDQQMKIHKHVTLMTSLFGSTYLCEQVFCRMKHVKNMSRLRITDGHLESSLHVATSSIMPDIEKLIGGKQCQVSH
ncbi:hypothetical protein PR048_025673 [Dryococelus australis]|uniref:Uncharacterized protein n=1 Tax=Dryococelus australis TaxID=614101 RepID=A0ABQ9GJ70_9NEOP|nr:hypothetical protein PR048_025673 [Dryococelus australis]